MEPLKKAERAVDSERQHLLILGAPRSGTTLLTAMIGRHSEVALLNEDKGWAMKSVVSKRVVGNKRCIPNQIDMKKRPFFKLRLFKTLGLMLEYPSSKYSIEDYLRLPNIKIIAIVRDGNDVISSIMKRNHKDFRAASYRWCQAVKMIFDLKKQCGDRVLLVSFEDLVMDPEPPMRRIASFLGLVFEKDVLEGYRYNPYYPEDQLNQDKVLRAAKEGVDFRLPERFPSFYQQYEELVALARTRP